MEPTRPVPRASSSIRPAITRKPSLCFDQVLARHGRDLEILIKRGACYLKLEKPERALADFDRVNQRSLWASRVFGQNAIYDPNSTWLPLPIPDTSFAESWGNRGIALLMLERNEEALASFKTAVQLWDQPQNRSLDIYAGRAAAYQGSGPGVPPAGRR